MLCFGPVGRVGFDAIAFRPRRLVSASLHGAHLRHLRYGRSSGCNDAWVRRRRGGSAEGARASSVGSDRQPPGARAWRRVDQPGRPPVSALAPCRCLCHADAWPIALCALAGLPTGHTTQARVCASPLSANSDQPAARQVCGIRPCWRGHRRSSCGVAPRCMTRPQPNWDHRRPAGQRASRPASGGGSRLSGRAPLARLPGPPLHGDGPGTADGYGSPAAPLFQGAAPRSQPR